jgi:hypothetical protein
MGDDESFEVLQHGLAQGGKVKTKEKSISVALDAESKEGHG